MLRTYAYHRSVRIARFAELTAAAAATVILPSCGGGEVKPVQPITAWRNYNTEGGGYSMEVPADWTVTERGGAGGFETTVRANADNWIVVSRQILPGSLEAKLTRSDERDPAIIQAVQSHYARLKESFETFSAGVPEPGTVGSSMAGFGSFTATRKVGMGGKTVEVQGATALVIGMSYLYVLDAYADAASSEVVQTAFQRMLDTFKFDE